MRITVHPIILDRNHEAPIPDGYEIIESEVQFLLHANDKMPLIIRGQRLCDWAQNYYDGRNITYNEIVLPKFHLVDSFPGLTNEQAQYICELLGKRISTLENFSANEILFACFPIPLWESLPSLKHSAEWLLWLDETIPNNAFTPVLRTITTDWKNSCPEASTLYDIVDPLTARETLQKWLGGKITSFIKQFGQFPITISEKWILDLQKTWNLEIIKTNGTFLLDIIKIPIEWRFKHFIAVRTLEFFEKHTDSEQFTNEIFDALTRFLSGNDLLRLSVIKPISEPEKIPDKPELVINWFTQEYLPFRERQVATKSEELPPRVLEYGKEFAFWYLDFYPKALLSKKYLSFFKSKNLRDLDSSHVNLLIILDGLQAIDAKYLLANLLSFVGRNRLVMTENDYCFAPLPTVTDFSKGALVHGVQPTFMKEFALLGEDVSEYQTPVPKLQEAKPGSLFMWRIQDPDHTYHSKNRSSMLRKDVEGSLSTIAAKILDVVNNVSVTQPLRIIITTDHGRFLGTSIRDIDIPANMEAHGRAAWGKTNIEYNETGYKIENDLVFLSKDRFGLISDDAAVILTDHAFRSEKQKKEICTHGGLFPEEVIIPWMVFERNISKPEIEIKINGKGQANQPGSVKVTVVNPSAIDIVISKIEFVFNEDDKYGLNVNQEIAGLEKRVFEINIPVWPSSEQVVQGSAQAIIQLPEGDEYTSDINLSGLQVTELYTRDKSLLEGLDL